MIFPNKHTLTMYVLRRDFISPVLIDLPTSLWNHYFTYILRDLRTKRD